MKRRLSKLLAWAFLWLLVWPTAIGTQDKFKKPADSASLPVLMKKPTITDVQHHFALTPPPELDILGSNFGERRGTKNVRIDGTLATSYLRWRTTSVTINPPFPLIYWDHVYQFAIVDGSTVLSNVFSTRIPYAFEKMTPREGLFGTVVSLEVYQLPASPDGLVLKIGTFDFPIVGWTPATPVRLGLIKARVPRDVPLGWQRVYLQKDGEIASEIYSFRLLPPTIPAKKILK